MTTPPSLFVTSRNRWIALLVSGLLLLGLSACKSQPNPQNTQDATNTNAAAAPNSAAPATPSSTRSSSTTSRRHHERSGSEAANAFPAPGANRLAGSSHAVATVEVPAGTVLPVRINQTLASDVNHSGETFQGQIAKPVAVNGSIAIPSGAAVTGQIVQVDNAGHFKGRSAVVIQVTGISYNGHSYSVSSNQHTSLSAARGKRSAEMIGGGAGVGALIGAIAGHGKGALIGAAAGAGAGTAAQALTHPPVAKIPAETVVNFRLSAPLHVTPANGTL